MYSAKQAAKKNDWKKIYTAKTRICDLVVAHRQNTHAQHRTECAELDALPHCMHWGVREGKLILATRVLWLSNAPLIIAFIFGIWQLVGSRLLRSLSWMLKCCTLTTTPTTGSRKNGNIYKREWNRQSSRRWCLEYVDATFWRTNGFSHPQISLIADNACVICKTTVFKGKNQSGMPAAVVDYMEKKIQRKFVKKMKRIYQYLRVQMISVAMYWNFRTRKIN